MAANINLNTATPVAGLGTSQITLTADGMYTVKADYTIPNVRSGTSANSTSTSGQSGLQIVIKQNSNTLVTVGGSTDNPTPYQPTLGASAQVQATAGDVIQVITSSSNAVDSVPNAVKGIINLYQGE